MNNNKSVTAGRQDSEPGFFAIIPATVRYNENLNFGTRLLFGEITALCSREGYCYAKNGYFADLYQVDTRTIKRWIADLENEEYISVEIHDGNQRKIYLTEASLGMAGVTKMSRGRGKNVPGGGQKCPPTLYRINTISNTIIKEKKLFSKTTERSSKGEKLSDVIVDLFEHQWGPGKGKKNGTH